MRQSLSERTTTGHRVVLGAAALSVVPAVAALVDQLGPRSLVAHAMALYGPFDKQIDAGPLYGAVYGVAVVGLVLWLIALRAGRWAVVVATVVTAAAALVLLTASEYGGTIFPPVWGLLALLPPVAGVVAAFAGRR